MKKIGVLGGIGPQATMDFEARVHACSQRLVPQDKNAGYPPMVVWYHRDTPFKMGPEGRPVLPVQANPTLLEGAAQLGRLVDFIAMPCNRVHLALTEIAKAAGRPVLSMIDVALRQAASLEWRKIGILSFLGAPKIYVEPLEAKGVVCATIEGELQGRLNDAITALMEGRAGSADREVARAAIAATRAQGVDGTILGCTEIRLLLEDEGDAPDLLNPSALLAEAAVRLAIGDAPAS